MSDTNPVYANRREKTKFVVTGTNKTQVKRPKFSVLLDSGSDDDDANMAHKALKAVKAKSARAARS